MWCSCLAAAQQSLNDVTQTKEDDGNACDTTSCKPTEAWERKMAKGNLYANHRKDRLPTFLDAVER